jgi:exodeoxyribonuclease III
MRLKVATFNVNGVRARLGILLDWLREQVPDVVCLQETKVQDQDFPVGEFTALGYRAEFWGQKSYNGVALLSRSEPEDVRKGFGDGQPDEQARFIAAKVAGLWVVNTYVPQGRDVADPAFQAKLDFFARLERWLAAGFTPEQPLLWLGDINVAPAAIDVFDPQRLEGQVGCHPAERQALAQVAAWGLSDLFRLRHPEVKQFTFWDYRLPKSFARNLGWRIDHILATEPLARACTEAWVDTAPRGREKPSDHTPVLAEFDLP